MRTACLLNSAGGPPGEIAFSSYFKQPCPLGKMFSDEGGHMIKMLLTVAVLGSVDNFASLAMAQGKQDEAFGSEVSSQCAHRRVMRPDPHDDCVRKPRSDAQLGYGQGGANQQLDQRDEGQPEVRREQPKASTSPKAATAPKASTSPKAAMVPAPKAKKANTPPRLTAQKEEQLYQEFLEWRKHQLFYGYAPY